MFCLLFLWVLFNKYAIITVEFKYSFWKFILWKLHVIQKNYKNEEKQNSEKIYDSTEIIIFTFHLYTPSFPYRFKHIVIIILFTYIHSLFYSLNCSFVISQSLQIILIIFRMWIHYKYLTIPIFITCRFSRHHLNVI